MVDAGFDLAAYLDRIGLAEVHPDIEGLRALQQAQSRAIPFENFDPLRGRVPALGIGDIFAKCVAGGRGGYCFEINSLFNEALLAAGFSTRRMLARVRMHGDASPPRSHLALRVDLDDRHFLADAGFGGHGPIEPLDLGIAGEQQIANGVFRLVDDPATGETVLECRQQEGWSQFYSFDFAHVAEGEIAAANYACATWDQAPFASHALISSHSGSLKYGLFDRSLTITGSDGNETRELTDFEDFLRVVRQDMGIALSREALLQAWENLPPPE